VPSGQERAIRRRIRSVQSTKKITRAMELIAASRIVKAQQRVAAARPYSEQITEVMRTLAASGRLNHPLLQEREEVGKIGYVVIAADRGLAGAYNVTVLRRAERAIQAVRRDGADVALFTSGKKAENYFRYRDYRIEEAYSGYAEQPSYEDARRLGQAAVSQYEEGDIDQVELVYTRFLSVGLQRVTVTRLLPLEREQVEEMAESHDGPQALYEMEPEPDTILEELLPRYVEARIFAALLDAAASEQAARQRAMKAATDNAEELTKKLNIEANKLRQASITTEIMEIVGGAEALRQSSDGQRDLLPDNLVSRDVLTDYLDPLGVRR
jgi:F-type H+-transporting ATPase subunit gamma